MSDILMQRALLYIDDHRDRGLAQRTLLPGIRVRLLYIAPGAARRDRRGSHCTVV